MSTIIDTLATDRTQADVERVKALAVKGYADMTAAEQPAPKPTPEERIATLEEALNMLLSGVTE